MRQPIGDRELFCTAGQAGPWLTEPQILLQSSQPDQTSACHRSACPTVLVRYQNNSSHAPESSNGTRNDALNSNVYPVSFPLSATTPNCIRCYPISLRLTVLFQCQENYLAHSGANQSESNLIWAYEKPNSPSASLPVIQFTSHTDFLQTIRDKSIHAC